MCYCVIVLRTHVEMVDIKDIDISSNTVCSWMKQQCGVGEEVLGGVSGKLSEGQTVGEGAMV